MEPYASLALLYDGLMNEVDYIFWADYIHALAQKYDAPGRHLLDLACGTGSLTLLLAEKGYDIIGVDLSADMLAIAANKGLGMDIPICNWYAMDMRELRLAEAQFDLVVCTCDGFNYLTGEQELKATLAGIRQGLAPQGLLLFDIHSRYKMEHIFPQAIFLQESGDGYCIWSSDYVDGRVTHELTIFTPAGDLWRRHEEIHHQYFFSENTIIAALTASGFEPLAVLPFGKLEGKPQTDCQRLQIVARLSPH